MGDQQFELLHSQSCLTLIFCSDSSNCSTTCRAVYYYCRHTQISLLIQLRVMDCFALHHLRCFEQASFCVIQSSQLALASSALAGDDLGVRFTRSKRSRFARFAWERDLASALVLSWRRKIIMSAIDDLLFVWGIADQRLVQL